MRRITKRLTIPLALILSFGILAVILQQGVLAAVVKNWQIQDQFSMFNAGVGGRDVSITQGLKGGINTFEVTTADSGYIQATRMLFRGAVDYTDTEFYSGPRGGEVLRLLINGASGNIHWGSGVAKLVNDQGGSLEIGGTGTPYFDLKNDPNIDFDMRMILTGDDGLNITGGRVGIDNNNPLAKLDVNGDIATRNSASISSNNNNFAGVGLGWNGDQANIRIGGDGPGAKNGLAIREVGDQTLLKIDETSGILNLTSDYSSICIGKC